MDTQEFLDLVARQQKTLVGLNIENLDLSQVNLPDIRFTDCRLHSVRFELSNLAGARFKNCHLYGAGFEFSNLTRGHFENCVLRNFFAYWSDLSDLVIADDCKVIEPIRIWNCRIAGAQLDSYIFDQYSGYIRFPKSKTQIDQAIRNRKAELREAAKQTELESQRQKEQAELADLGALPVSELLRRFRSEPDNDRLAMVIDRKLGIAQS